MLFQFGEVKHLGNQQALKNILKYINKVFVPCFKANSVLRKNPNPGRNILSVAQALHLLLDLSVDHKLDFNPTP